MSPNKQAFLAGGFLIFAMAFSGAPANAACEKPCVSTPKIASGQAYSDVRVANATERVRKMIWTHNVNGKRVHTDARPHRAASNSFRTAYRPALSRGRNLVCVKVVAVRPSKATRKCKEFTRRAKKSNFPAPTRANYSKLYRAAPGEERQRFSLAAPHDWPKWASGKRRAITRRAYWATQPEAYYRRVITPKGYKARWEHRLEVVHKRSPEWIHNGAFWILDRESCGAYSPWAYYTSCLGTPGYNRNGQSIACGAPMFLPCREHGNLEGQVDAFVRYVEGPGSRYGSIWSAKNFKARTGVY